jgi:xylulokinase
MTPAHLARATMEGVTLGLAYGLNRFRALGIAPDVIRLTGGGSQSAVWRQICADVFNCPVITLAEPEGAALGACLQALAAHRPEKSINDWADELVKINSAEANTPRDAAIYQEAAEKQVSLTRALTERGFL